MISLIWLNVLYDLQRKCLQLTDPQIRDEEIQAILLYNTPLAISNDTRCRGRGCWHLVVGTKKTAEHPPTLRAIPAEQTRPQSISVETEKPRSDNSTWC